MRRPPHRRPESPLSVLLAAVLGVSGWSLAAAAPARGAEPGAQGTVVADTGFRPTPNGFSFANWGGSEKPQANLTVADAQCLFGNDVCARVTGGRCEPTPAARMWIAEMNKEMREGHCEGLAVLSAAFFAGQRQPQTYGGKTAYELKESNSALLRTVSTFFVTQSLEPVYSAMDQTLRLSIREIVDTLVQAMKSRQEVYTLGIFGEDDGHAITPYAVEDVGKGRYLIHVYDNNYPGVGNVVEVDTGADKWRYAAAALNPAEAAAPWEGTSGAMALTPLSARFKPLVCPFCAADAPNSLCAGPGSPQGPAQPTRTPAQPTRTPAQPARAPARPPRTPPRAPAPAGPSSVITSANCDQVSVVDKKSRSRAAFAQGKMASQIPGVKVTRRLGSRGCAVQLPPGSQYDVSVAGRPGQPAQPLDATVFRPGQVISLGGGAVTAGRVESMGIGDTSFSYRPSSGATPTFAMATDYPEGKDGYYEVSSLALGAGRSFEIGENESGQIVFDSDDPKLVAFDIKVRLEDEQGAQDLTFDNVAFDDQGQALLGPDDQGRLVYGMDTDSDGIINALDPDDDNDGRPDAVDTDDDNDGIPDAQDQDDDNDGALDAADADEDGDGAPDVEEEPAEDPDNPPDVDDDAPEDEEEPAEEPDDPPPAGVDRAHRERR